MALETTMLSVLVAVGGNWRNEVLQSLVRSLSLFVAIVPAITFLSSGCAGRVGLLVAKGRLDAAESRCNKSVPTACKAECFRMVGDAYFDRKDFARAVDNYDRGGAPVQTPRVKDSLLRLGIEAAEAGDFRGADVRLARAGYSPSDADLLIAEVCTAKPKEDCAPEAVARLRRAGYDEGSAFVAVGAEFFQRGIGDGTHAGSGAKIFALGEEYLKRGGRGDLVTALRRKKAIQATTNASALLSRAHVSPSEEQWAKQSAVSYSITPGQVAIRTDYQVQAAQARVREAKDNRYVAVRQFLFAGTQFDIVGDFAEARSSIRKAIDACGASPNDEDLQGLKSQGERLLQQSSAKTESTGVASADNTNAAPQPGSEMRGPLPSIRRVIPPLSLGLPATTAGTDIKERIGFYFRFGGGAGDMGWASTSSDGSGTTYRIGFAGSGAIGAALVPGLALTFEIASRIDTATTKSSVYGSTMQSGRWLFVTFGPGVNWFPSPDLGLHLGLSVGPGIMEWKGDSGGASGERREGYGAVGRVGYYWPVSNKWQLGGEMEAIAFHLDGASYGGGATTTMSIAIMLGGVAF